ncbi:hypothetical protein E2C01_062357 [Portunus trituberculatus]|uniref:Uncharacterized protein n=1 Tax=Portunus trituberculatus TaxID=210409 RepID=A0A5B7H7M4_PORTR|nr:hypothetical protein [Portunus trituberculatus]
MLVAVEQKEQVASWQAFVSQIPHGLAFTGRGEKSYSRLQASRTLYFGFASTSQVFTKVMAPISAWGHRCSIPLLH